jgi:hypothetical protein
MFNIKILLSLFLLSNLYATQFKLDNTMHIANDINDIIYLGGNIIKTQHINNVNINCIDVNIKKYIDDQILLGVSILTTPIPTKIMNTINTINMQSFDLYYQMKVSNNVQINGRASLSNLIQSYNSTISSYNESSFNVSYGVNSIYEYNKRIGFVLSYMFITDNLKFLSTGIIFKL